MLYGSVCSGIEAATAAWEPLGWRSAFFSEIEAFPSAVLKHHYPDTPNLGDMTKFKEWPDACHCNTGEHGGADGKERTTGERLRHDGSDVHSEHNGQARDSNNQIGVLCEKCGGANIDVLVGGTPCQSFSIAGLRKGLADPRGNLMLTYGAIAGRYRPLWLVWENVPGVLSSNGGKDFGTFLGMLAELGYGFAYRVLDAQYFGVPQRRRRVFVVGYFGDWRPAAAVLFECHSLQGHTPPSRKKGERVAPTVASGPPYSRTGNERVECEALVSIGVDEECNASVEQFGPLLRGGQGGTRQTVAICMETGQGNAGIGIGIGTTLNCNHEAPIVTCPTLTAANNPSRSPQSAEVTQQIAAVLEATRERVCVCRMREGKEGGGKGPLISDDVSLTLATGNDQTMQYGSTVRRLTPRECERLQGFPDDYTLIPWKGKSAEQCPDGPRYKALGNSMAVPCMVWIGQRIELVNNLMRRGK